MANQKVYTIQINGLTESISAVESLNKQLDALDKKISALKDKSVDVGKKSTSTSSLSEEAKLEKQIAQLEEKRIAHSKEIYQNYLAAKDVLKETENDQKQIAASERLAAKAYSNTIAGMKQELADIKSVMQTVDVGDSSQLNQMIERAKVLNDKLKEIEQSYGQFGRNVGNYSSAFDGMQKLSISIGGVTREFNSAREASKTLKNELIGLEAAGSGNTEVAKELRAEYYKLQSAMDDATKSSKAMDVAMDTMQSFTAMASVGNGLKAFFGFDDNEIQKSIQRLVALQGVLTGLETIRKQMETGEGFGAIFSKSFNSVDAASQKLLVYNRALLGTGTAAKAAEVGIKGLTVASKALASIGIVALITGIAWAIQKAAEAISKWVKGNADLVTSEQRLKAALDATNDSLERNLKLNQAKYDAGKINVAEKQIEDEKAYAAAIRQTNEELDRRAKLNSNNSTFANAMKNAGASSWSDFFKNDKGVTTLGGFTEAAGSIDELTKRYKALSDAVEKDTGLVYKNAKGFEICHLSASDVRDELNHLEQFMAGQLVGTMKQFDTTTDQGRQTLQNFVNGIMQSDDDLRKSILLRLPEIVDNEKGNLGTALNSWLSLIKQFVAGADAAMNALNFEKYVNSILDAADETGKRMAQRQKDELTARYNALSDEEKKAQKSNYDKAMKAIDQLENKKRQKVSNNYKKLEKETREAENDLANLRIENMKEGLNKVLKQLEEERKQRLAKVQADGKLVGERQTEINKLYDKKILDAKKEWAENVEKTYKSMWDNIYSYSLETTSKIADVVAQSAQIGAQNLEYKRSALSTPENSSYGVQGKNQLSLGTQTELQLEEQNNKEISQTYNQRLRVIKAYWNERINFETSAATTNYNAQVLLENKNYEKEKRDNAEHSQELFKQTEKSLKDGLITQQQYDEITERNLTEHLNRERILENQHNNKLVELEHEKVNRLQGINAEYYRNRLQELRDFQTAIANLESKQPVYDKFGWGIINLSETKKNNENLLKSYRTLADEIVILKRQLQEKLEKKEISFDDFQNANRELDTFAENVGQKMDEVKYELSLGAQIGSFIQSINQYVQAGLQAVQTVLNAVDEYNTAMLDKEQETLDKENEALDKKLDEQEDIINKHKSAIDSIEDELANSRGDRRQHLIDQLNAEMEAERRAAAEKKRIEKEQEALEKRQDDIDRKRKEAEYHRNINSIIISNAMAVANGYATQPFMPVGLAMGTLALALGAVQLALAKAAKPYAFGGQLDGGQIVGNRHRDGGVKVLGGRAEVEGGEYITNRLTTAKNLDLLEYVNSKKKRIDISDMLEFYNGGRVKTSIQKVRTKFEDGGYIAPLPDTIDIKEQLQNIVVNQDNRPIYVSVVDINNKQADVRRVQTLAGLSE